MHVWGSAIDKFRIIISVVAADRNALDPTAAVMFRGKEKGEGGRGREKGEWVRGKELGERGKG